MITFIDQDIAHIARVMRPTLTGDLDGPILPSAYWRKRLYQLLDAGHLTKIQLCRVDSLLLELDEFDGSRPAFARACQASPQVSSARYARAVRA